MIYCILSDTHRNTEAIDKMLADIKLRELKIDAFIHAGDLAADTDYIKLQTGLEVYTVYGNCDAYTHRQLYKPDEFIQVADKYIWITHGHRYIQSDGVLDQLVEQAHIFGVDIVIYGHTHQVNVTTIDNIVYINPGSISLPRDNRNSYAVLQINGTTIETNIYEI